MTGPEGNSEFCFPRISFISGNIEIRGKQNLLFPKVPVIKGPLKYLIAKLHSCYPGANSLPVSQNFFARFFRRRSVADSSRCLTFLLRCSSLQQTQKTLFAYNFFINVLLYGYNMEWCLYFLNLAVLFENFIHVRTY